MDYDGSPGSLLRPAPLKDSISDLRTLRTESCDPRVSKLRRVRSSPRPRTAACPAQRRIVPGSYGACSPSRAEGDARGTPTTARPATPVHLTPPRTVRQGHRKHLQQSSRVVEDARQLATPHPRPGALGQTRPAPKICRRAK